MPLLLNYLEEIRLPFEKTGKNELTAIQLSSRRGFLKCKYTGDRVEISGQCRLYLTGEIFIE